LARKKKTETEKVENPENLPEEPKKDKYHSKIDIRTAVRLRYVKGLSYADIGRYFGVPRQSVESALSRFKGLMLSKPEIEAYEESKHLILSSVEAELTKQLTDKEKLEKASLNNVAYAFKQVFDSNRLQRGQSTSNIAYADLTQEIDAAEKEIEELQSLILPGSGHTDGHEEEVEGELL